MVSRTTANVVETWELGEMLAMLGQIAQDTGEVDGEPRAGGNNAVASESPVTAEGGSRP